MNCEQGLEKIRQVVRNPDEVDVPEGMLTANGIDPSKMSEFQKDMTSEEEIDLPEGMEIPNGAEPPADVPPRPPLPQTGRQDEDFSLSDDALALDLGGRGWDEDAKYVDLWKTWLFWNGSRWEIDQTAEALAQVRTFLRIRADEVAAWAARKGEVLSPGERKRLLDWSKKQGEILRGIGKIDAVKRTATTNLPSMSHPDHFDTDLMLLGTPGGTVDLRTGDLRPADRRDMITKLATVTPAERGTQPERWLSFLDEVFAGDQRLVDFMQRAAGYALTGRTDEHKLLFLYGTGRNGKSVFLNTLFWLWGDYARKAAAETFLNSNVERHSTDIAGLKGARLVMGSELPRGKTWDESVIKDLTGGDKMSARFMRQDFFDFVPQLTLVIAGNTQPSFRGVDEAIRSRLVMVPFAVTIPKERRDTGLQDKLKAEGPAILRWCIEGAWQWQRRGLDVPASVAAASDEYFDSEDTVGQFLEAEVERVVGGFETSANIHQRFVQWIEKQGMSAWTQTTLIKELRGRGFTDGKSGSQRGLKGLRLRWL